MHTTLTTKESSIKVILRVSIERSIRSERSYVVTILTPSGRPGSMSFLIFSLTLSMTFRTFSPNLTTTMPPATSPFPSSSASPLLISGPSCTEATSRSNTGVPAPFVPTEMYSMSWTDLIYPLPRTMYSTPENSRTLPSTSLLLLRTASMTFMRGMLYAESLVGSMLI